MKKEFKVGDRVIGNKYANGHYSFTTQGWIGTVIRVTKHTIEVKDDSDTLGRDFFTLDPDCFDLYEEFPQDAETVETYLIRSMKTIFKKHEKV